MSGLTETVEGSSTSEQLFRVMRCKVDPPGEESPSDLSPHSTLLVSKGPLVQRPDGSDGLPARRHENPRDTYDVWMGQFWVLTRNFSRAALLLCSRPVGGLRGRVTVSASRVIWVL